LPAAVTVKRLRHPLQDRSLRVLGGMRRHGVMELLLELPDGSKSLIPAAWTDAEQVAGGVRPAHAAVAGKTFGDWDEAASSIPRATQDALKTLEWISNKETLCICGPSGTGKSHFCEALGQAAVEEGLTVARFTIEDLGALMRRHRVDDSIAGATPA
jgi:IstB-like ATP binding protein